MTGLPLNGKVIDLAQLRDEMIAAGLVITALGSDGLNVFTYDNAGMPADLPGGSGAVLTAHTPSTVLHDALVTALTSTVGVALTSLTQAQRLALVVGLLYKAGAIDRQSLTVKPLATWLF